MAPKFCRFHKRGLLSLPLVEHTKLTRRSYLCSKLHFAVNSLAWRPGTVLHAQGFVITRFILAHSTSIRMPWRQAGSVCAWATNLGAKASEYLWNAQVARCDYNNVEKSPRPFYQLDFPGVCKSRERSRPEPRDYCHTLQLSEHSLSRSFITP